MKCIIDTNVLISASLFPQSVPAQAFLKAITLPNTAVVCDYSIDELYRVYNKKFQNKLYALEAFLASFLRSVRVIDTPPTEEATESEAAVRDADDRPILRAAVKSGVDVLITGDRDFLESGIKHPHIVTPADFLKL
jgi:putative PIN family toxin of toxin-antitoxin system